MVVVMFEELFRNNEVKKLLYKICNNPRYYGKRKKDSINYEKFTGVEQPLFIVLDALFKYQIIIQDNELLDEFVRHLDLLFYKIDNFHDISAGLPKILVKFCARKLGYKNKEKEHRLEILTYIYQKYIVDGYFYHGVADAYIATIQKEGFMPQQYQNLYSKFQVVQKKCPSFFSDIDFEHSYVSFTDNFTLACYYATYTPLYFSNLLCRNGIKKIDTNSYARRDYMACFRNLNMLLQARECNEEDSKLIQDVCNEEWKLLQRNEAIPTVMLIKRKVLSKDFISGIEDIYENDTDELSVLASRILDAKYDNFQWEQFIPPENLQFVSIDYYPFLEEEEKEVIIPVPADSDENNQYGKVSFLLLAGASLIILGVLITIIMISKGI